ncbi:transporter [Neomegalonema sp.]|uniref:transporter n=1 Tax=Neomegalonema sp. TaxID=2039713 RepID=UPI0026074D32|nr:transporter [Neomegalonema sp.]MDD2869779.1 transporter [Neomegalonema sp.]
MRLSTLAPLAAGAFLHGAAAASASDIAPGDYVAAPPGSNLFLLYLKGATSGDLHNELAGDVPDSKLDTTVALLRYVRYEEIAGTPVAVQAIRPVGAIPDVRIGGANPPTAEGFGDLTLAATVFPVNTAMTEPYGTSLGATLYVGTPTGAYDPGEVSLGSGTWTLTPQIGVTQNLGPGWFFDGALDVAFRLDHTENGDRYARDPAWQVQGYLRRNLTDKVSLALGYSGLFGGASSVNGADDGSRTRADQIRVFGSAFVTPTLQLQAMIGTDLHASGGFRQDLNAELRLLKIF